LSSTEETIIPKLNIRGRSEFKLGKGTILQVIKELIVEERGIFNIVNGGKSIVKVGEYVQKGKVEMEVFGDEVGEEEWGRSDQIICEGRVRLRESSRLEIHENGCCRGKSYMLIKYGSLDGRFGSVLASNHEVEYRYGGKWIVLLPKQEEIEVGNLGICNIVGSSLGRLEKEKLSSNEKEVADKLNYLSCTVGYEKDKDKKTALRILVGLEEGEEKMLMIMWLMEARENNFSEHRKSGNV
jgi:hypothetical protein